MEVKLINYGYLSKPQRAHENDAGYDVFTKIGVLVPANTVVKIPLGFGVELPAGFMANIYPRSGKSLEGLLPQLPPIDCGYTGEVHAIVLNATNKDIFVKEGTKIGQMVILPIYHFNLVDKVDSSRGAAGFGSTDQQK